ncbi:hypothetical protein F5Y04DRAFT_269913 [Hypomontagnella monticulosa]|nr:hypothetical protein F5Y04DRAFT_269913 [Hypomontagnella monticulosa]
MSVGRQVPPPVQHPVHTLRDSDVRDYPKNPVEFIFQAIVGDPDRKWGPLYRHIRAARKAGRWREWSLRDLVNEEPLTEPDGRGARSDGAYNLARELNDDVRPAQLDFSTLLDQAYHSQDYDDEFFQRHYENLYVAVVIFVSKWFDCNVSLGNLAERDEIWTMHMTDQFIEYARIVAHDDSLNGRWPVILNDPAQRKWLIVGIIGQIMEKKIFNELLFGADKEIEDELTRLDTKWMGKEGYGRKAARAITARYGVEGRLIPRDFWICVDDLTAKTVKILLPLYNVFKEAFPNHAKREGYRLDAFQQQLHAIISYAGLIQVCMAISPSIFHFLSATPGARMDYEVEEQADSALYRQSKDFWEQRDAEWNANVNAILSGNPVTISTMEKIDVPNSATERRQMEYHRIRGARVKFAVFPKVTRYRPINRGIGQRPAKVNDDGQVFTQQEGVEGQSIVDISKCKVVYYQGIIYPKENAVEDGHESLQEHMNSIVTQSNGLTGLFARIFGFLFSKARRVFWHVFVIGLFAWSLYSLYAGWPFILWLLVSYPIFLIWISFCIYVIASTSFKRNENFAAWAYILVPLAVIYVLGTVQTLSGQPMAPRNETFTWIYVYVLDICLGTIVG